ncbi:hypothetical protein EDB84DRAFT_1197913 [Lactarius hengduanensis]|nr:hypothetical protein EDB84DRAFT_1197913 [Lactarius hengduanensis]
MTAISITGPGDDPAPVSRENDGQTDPARKATDGDVETRDRDFESQPPPVPAGASRRSTSSQSRVPSRRMSKTPLFLPSPSSEGTSSEPLIRQRDRDRDHDPLDIISHIHRLLFLFLTTTTSLAQPAQDQETEGTGAADGVRPRAASRPARASQTICRLSNDPAHASAKTAAKGKARAGDNAGPKELVHVLQVAFENNWPGAGSTGPSGKKTKKAVKETVVVVDDEDDEEEESDKSKIPHAPRPGVSCGIYTQFNES